MNALAGASGTTFNGPVQFGHGTIGYHGTSREGIQTLLGHSMPEAAHDSSARYPPPRCHPGTRLDVSGQINSWRLNEPNLPILWMEGPAGVGKSAMAQTYAESLARSGDLGAAFFFSRSHGRDDPNRFFTSISYQIAMKFEPYKQLLNTKISDDPTLVTKSIREQFLGLIAGPLKELKDQRLKNKVMVVDGFDDCANSNAQRDIVETVAEDTTGYFRWIFFSRSGREITTIFTSKQVSPLSKRVELSKSPDSDIRQYLTEELGKVGPRGLLSPWPSEEDIRTIVKLSGGLFIFAATVVRFVSKPPGPVDQLKSVLSTGKAHHSPSNDPYPLSELDAFYELIMQNIPSENLATAQEILLATTFPSCGTRAINIADLLNLSGPRFQHVCDSLHSVLALKTLGGSTTNSGFDDIIYQEIRFSHESFMEFLQDPTRSGDFCIHKDRAEALRSRLFEELNSVHAAESLDQLFTRPFISDTGPASVYQSILEAFFTLCQLKSVDLGPKVRSDLKKFRYEMIPVLSEGPVHLQGVFVESLLQNMPKRTRRKIVTSANQSLFPSASYPSEAIPDEPPFILGYKKSKVLCWKTGNGLLIHPHQERPRSSVLKALYGFIRNK